MPTLAEMREYGASRSALRAKFGTRRIDASAPNVSGSKTGMRRAADGFSEGWDEFFKKPQAGTATVTPPARSGPISTFDVNRDLGGNAPAWAPGASRVVQGPHGAGFATSGPTAQEIATTFESFPSLTRGAVPPSGFEDAVAGTYLKAARNVLGRRDPRSTRPRL